MKHVASSDHGLARGRVVGLLAALLLVLGLLSPGVPTLDAAPAAAATCPCSLWSGTATPLNPTNADAAAVELGVKFRSDVAGVVTGVRFYKGSGNTGTHVGSLWTRAGVRLASATFSGETSTGWQQVSFANPVAVAAGTTYVASYLAPNGRYAVDTGAFATSGVDNGPLHALAEGVDGSNGVYRYGTGGGFPANTYQSANYWVDVVFAQSAADTTPPSLTGRSPSPGSTGVLVGSATTGTFSEDVSGATVALTGPAGAVAGASSYDSAIRAVSFRPAAPLAAATSYTVSVTGARDAAGNVMAADTWSYTTAASTGGCPCSLWPTTASPATASAADNNAVEVGVRFRPAAGGFVSGLRFFRGPANTGTQVGNLWRADGTLLASAAFASGPATGWQQVTLASPVPVTAGTDYVASYHAPNGGYAMTSGFFATEYARPPLTAPASSPSAPNGVYRYGASGFPSATFNATSYWVDVLFDTSAVDARPPAVVGRSPADGATAVATGAAVTATFDEAVNPSSVALSLRSGSGAVAGATAYDGTSRTATFTPAGGLAASTAYTATAAASDVAGNAASPVSWSFTTASPAPPPTATNGPVLVVANAGQGFGRFLPEILRTEGLNAHSTAEPTALTAANLAPYDVVVLGETALSATQVTVLTNWVTAGGNLIAMRPDRQLSQLLGLTSATGTWADRYLLVNAAAAPGAGITAETMQFHGTADRYTLNGASSVATLYSGVATATTNPAVTLRSVGTSGGQAAAFTYDLARSVAYTRQGNPAFAGLERDGQSPIRSDDMFWGSTAAGGYVNLNKVSVPQADEQQRLLTNLIQVMNRDRKPLPRFWYFPRMAKAVVVATGDDHGNGGTAGRFDQYEANSTAGCSVVLWSCLRFSSYVYPSTPLPAAQARAYDAKGFETGPHPTSDCANVTPASLETIYASQLSQWRTVFAGLPAPTTSRFHCLVWSDWASQPRTEVAHGIGLDANYYYWPGSWVGDRPGFMTGSGMPMRFADLDGTVLDSYQAATQMTDESGQSYPSTPNALLDKALGPQGYYGAFTANVHTDQATSFENDQLIASARARGVPIIAARQLLTWLKARDAARLTGLAWSGNALSFAIAPGAGSEGLTAMLPTAGPSGSLASLAANGTAVAYSTQTVKGLEYAVFPAAAASYTATYGAAGGTALTGALRTSATADPVDGEDGIYVRGPQRGRDPRAPVAVDPDARKKPGARPDATAPSISAVEVLSLPDGTATVTWQTDEDAAPMVRYGSSATGLTDRREDRERRTEHSVTLTDLVPGSTYHYRPEATDAAGNTALAPPARFVQSAAGVADTTAAALRVGTRDAGAAVAARRDGELQLASDDSADFDLPRLPSGWTTEAERGGRTVVYGGKIRLEGTRATGRQGRRPGPIEFSATFTGSDQSGGLAAKVDGPWALFVSRGGRLYASINDGRTEVERQLPDSLLGSAHRFRVERTNVGAALFVDDAEVASGPLQGAAQLRPMFRDLDADDQPLTLDWVHPVAFSSASTYVSRVLDAHQLVTWDRAVWRADVPAGTTLQVSVRVGSRRTADPTWSAWTPLSGPGARVAGEGRYLQYRVELSTSSERRTPVLHAIGFTHNGSLPRRDRETG